MEYNFTINFLRIIKNIMKIEYSVKKVLRGKLMLPKEADWLLKNAVPKIENNTTLLNIGSSNKKFITKVQPHIYYNLIEPLYKKGIKIINVDIKKEKGVDIIANILDKSNRERIKNIDYKNILCSNVLEHIIDLKNFCDSLSELLPLEGYLIITVPYKYPYHPDPIDTMFRPSINQLEEYFHQMELVLGEIVDCGTVKEYQDYKRKIKPITEYISISKSILKQLILLCKFEKRGKNKIITKELCHDSHYLVTCAIFRRKKYSLYISYISCN